jgi:hypothetical protein
MSRTHPHIDRVLQLQKVVPVAFDQPHRVHLAPRRGFSPRLPAVSDEEIHALQLMHRSAQATRSALINDLRIMSPQSASEAAVESSLSAALCSLLAARRGAEDAGYGDQFRGALNEAIAQVECTRGMLA